MIQYSIQKTAKMAGVSIRTLHLYDEIGLLKPCERTASNYRLYSEKELLRLQQILFYKELGFSLKHIQDILDKPDFHLIHALEQHKKALITRQARLSQLLNTLDQTIFNLKQGDMMLNKAELHEALYEGFEHEQAEAWHNEAQEKYGEEAMTRSYQALGKMSKTQLAELKAEQQEIWETLRALQHENPRSEAVQTQMARHYQNTRTFWGTAHSTDSQKEAFAGLGAMYLADERFTALNGQPQPQFATFLNEAMAHFAETRLSKRC